MNTTKLKHEKLSKTLYLKLCSHRPRKGSMILVHVSTCLMFQLNAKYSVESEQQCRQWIEAVIGEPLSNQEVGMHQFQECLKDGQVLCKYVFIVYTFHSFHTTYTVGTHFTLFVIVEYIITVILWYHNSASSKPYSKSKKVLNNEPYRLCSPNTHRTKAFCSALVK